LTSTLGSKALIICALTHWGFFWANTAVIYIAEVYDNYEHLGFSRIGGDERDGMESDRFEVPVVV
jgi:hypothetical protein